MSTILVIIAAFWGATLCLGSPCNTGNNTECLDSLRNYLTRSDWWFGQGYRTRCPSNSKTPEARCINPDPQHTTIISRALQRTDFDVNNINQVLRIRYYVPAGTYLACGHRFHVPVVDLTYDIDHANIMHLDMWTISHRPAVIWNHEPGAWYTLVTYDVGRMALGGLWVNIQGGDSALGYELQPYSGPLTAIVRPTFYVFLLFKQNQAIGESHFDAIKDHIRQHMKASGGVYTLEKLIDMVDEIKEPIGAGLIMYSADPYGIQSYKSSHVVNNCPWLISRMRPLLSKVVDVHNLTALGADVNELNVEVEVMYRSEEISYTSCCVNRTEPEMTIRLDALSQGAISPVFLRERPHVRLAAVNMMDSLFFFDKLYTILLLDVTMATMDSGMRMTSLLWLVTDIRSQYITTGRTHMDYVMPTPPMGRPGNSLYTFFVFEQHSDMGDFILQDYCGDSESRDCNFNLYQFVEDHQLHLSGVNWFQAKPDHYSRKKLYDADPDQMDAVCARISSYGNPCPDKCASHSQPTNEPDTSKNKGGNGGENLVTANCAMVLSFVIAVLYSQREQNRSI